MLRGDTLTGRANYRQETCVPTSAKSTEFALKWRTHHQSGGEQRDHGIAGIDRRWEPRLSFTRDVRIGWAYGNCRLNRSACVNVHADRYQLALRGEGDESHSIELVFIRFNPLNPCIFSVVENPTEHPSKTKKVTTFLKLVELYPLGVNSPRAQPGMEQT
jgi:hypothetical protein